MAQLMLLSSWHVSSPKLVRLQSFQAAERTPTYEQAYRARSHPAGIFCQVSKDSGDNKQSVSVGNQLQPYETGKSDPLSDEPQDLMLLPSRRKVNMNPKGGQRRRALIVAVAVTAVSVAGFAGLSRNKASAALALPEFASPEKMAVLTRTGEVAHTEEEWKQLLSPSAYRVLRKASTELPYSSALNKEKRMGTFLCGGCGTSLFASEAKYDSGTGWPSFYQALPGRVEELSDFSIVFLPRTEVRCQKCKSHLGHVFDDGPKPTGKRYCMNGVALAFEPNATVAT